MGIKQILLVAVLLTATMAPVSAMDGDRAIEKMYNEIIRIQDTIPDSQKAGRLSQLIKKIAGVYKTRLGRVVVLNNGIEVKQVAGLLMSTAAKTADPSPYYETIINELPLNQESILAMDALGRYYEANNKPGLALGAYSQIAERACAKFDMQPCSPIVINAVKKTAGSGLKTAGALETYYLLYDTCPEDALEKDIRQRIGEILENNGYKVGAEAANMAAMLDEMKREVKTKEDFAGRIALLEKAASDNNCSIAATTARLFLAETFYALYLTPMGGDGPSLKPSALGKALENAKSVAGMRVSFSMPAQVHPELVDRDFGEAGESLIQRIEQETGFGSKDAVSYYIAGELMPEDPPGQEESKKMGYYLSVFEDFSDRSKDGNITGPEKAAIKRLAERILKSPVARAVTVKHSLWQINHAEAYLTLSAIEDTPERKAYFLSELAGKFSQENHCKAETDACATYGENAVNLIRELNMDPHKMIEVLAGIDGKQDRCYFYPAGLAIARIYAEKLKDKQKAREKCIEVLQKSRGCAFDPGYHLNVLEASSADTAAFIEDLRRIAADKSAHVFLRATAEERIGEAYMSAGDPKRAAAEFKNMISKYESNPDEVDVNAMDGINPFYAAKRMLREVEALLQDTKQTAK